MKTRLMLLALLTGGLTMAVACGDLEEDCDPAADASCTCTNDAGDTCDPETYEGDDECTCTSSENNSTGNNAANNSTGNNSTGNNSTNNSTGNNSSVAYRFVLVEDSTANPSGEFPGMDIDTISVIKAGGGEFYASAVEDANVGGNGNNAADVNQLLGAPDANCEAQSGAFTALGGMPNNGYAIVSFSTSDTDVTIETGDRVKIYELGRTLCGMFDDDPGSVSVSTSTGLGTFVKIGDAGTGNFEIVVPALP